MKYFKDENGAVFAYDLDQLNLVTESMTEMTDSEMQDHSAPYVKTAYDLIEELESTRTPRREREARMGIEGAQDWLDLLDMEIEELRP